MLKKWIEIFFVSLRLGLTSFGGPAAHLAYFREEYIKRRNWLDEKSFADLIALCQFLPGPASSQVGISIGMVRGGILGGVISWLGFTLPSVLALVLFAYFVESGDMINSSWIHGLKLVAVAVVAHAIIGMGKKLTPDRERMTIAILAAIATLLVPTAIGQLVIIAVAALIGYGLYRSEEIEKAPHLPIKISKKLGVLSWFLFFSLLVILPLGKTIFTNLSYAIFDTFYRVGSLVFGGGHVVLPMLEREVVPNGWLSEEMFLTGYAGAQAVPGPLFTLSGFLGGAIGGWQIAMIAVIGIFLPSFLLLIGTLPFWNTIRSLPYAQGALKGVNAAVVGLLLAALYNPVFTSAVLNGVDLAVVLLAFSLLHYWKWPAWFIVIFTAFLGFLTSFLM
ncbi:chromate efflux transporter [Bacillus sp. 2205SS5-2]|uniref:chromate efflux transporter n=1 Tax=Bacillus sp. 2205SS5-2 TaxID=3109031 RepID=UPI003006F5DF